MLFIVWNTDLCLIDISVFLSWGWKDTCTNIPHGDLEGRDPAARTVGGDWGVRACGLTPSAVSLWGFGPCGLNLEQKCLARTSVDTLWKYTWEGLFTGVPGYLAILLSNTVNLT
jgi:hypothetical protein